MTNEEMQRTMEFIVQQQAQFAANIQRLQEERLRDSPRLSRLEQSFQLLVRLAQNTDIRLDRLETTTTALETTTTALGTTTTALGTTTSALESNMAALAAAQTHADERLTALIEIVQEGRNNKTH